jgi:PKD repeat protein
MKTLYQFILGCLFITVSLTASAQCNSGFTYSVSATDSSLYTFTDSTTRGSWSLNTWSFSDGSTYSGSPITHRFKYNDTFTVCHTVMDSTRTCIDSTCKTIIVNTRSNVCYASFTTRISGDTVWFTNTSSTAQGYQWSFGDGTGSSAKSPMHIFSRAGTPKNYTVCLSITDTINNCYDSTCVTVTVGSRASCRAGFTVATTKDTAIFKNTSNSNSLGVYWTWDFGDGTSSNSQDPTHVYSRYGVYNVCLVMLDSVNNCTSTYCDSIQVDSGSVAACKASFNPSVNGLNVSINNTSTGANTFYWTFGDGTSSTAKNPRKTYSKTGTFTICLYISGSGVCTDSVCRTVQVFTTNCKAAFRVAIDTTKKFRLYLINSSSNLSSHTYQWSFGDGSSSTLRNPKHQYATFGRYLVCLTVTDSVYRCSQTYCDSIGMDSTGKLLKAAFELEVIEDEFSSMPQTEVLNWNIYPNPVIDLLHVDYEQSGSLEMSVYDMKGSVLLKSFSLEGSDRTINVQELPMGLYILEVTDGDSVFRGRFIKSE